MNEHTDANHTTTEAEAAEPAVLNTPDPENPEANETEAPAQSSWNNPYGYGNNYSSLYIPRTEKPEYQKVLSVTAESKSTRMLLPVWLLCVLFSETFLRSGFGFGLSIPLTVILFYGIALWFFRPKEGGYPKGTLPLVAANCLLSTGFFLVHSPFTHFVNFLVMAVLFFLSLGKLGGYPFGAVSGRLLREGMTAALESLTYLGMPFKTISATFKVGERKTLSGSLKIILGVIIALPLAAIFLALFSSADEAFGELIEKILENIGMNVFWIFFDVIFGSFLFIFAAALLLCGKGHTTPESHTAEPAPRKGAWDTMVCTSFLAVISLVHVFYIVFQLSYMFGGESFFRGSEYSYGSYVHSGFYELCVSSTLVFFLVFLTFFFIKRTEAGQIHGVVKGSISLLVLCNLCIFASLIYRMYIYIQSYDLSVERVLLLWFVALVGLCSVGVVLKFFRESTNLFRYISVTVVLMTVALNAVNVNALVARYNVDHYFEDTAGRSFDVYYIDSLGVAATPALVDLYKNETVSQKVKEEARSLLVNQSYDIYEHTSWRNTSLPVMLALDALKSSDIPAIGKDGYDAEGYDRYGRNKDGYDKEGYNGSGFNREGYDREGYDMNGYNRDGYGRNGCDIDGYNTDGYDWQGYDREGYTMNGFYRGGYDSDGYDMNGYNIDGFDRNGNPRR